MGLSFRSSTIQGGQTAAVASLFITGGSGFVGRALLTRLSPGQFDRVYCLSRRAIGGLSNSPNVTVIRGTLQDIGNCERELTGSDAVIHLAAATGKLPPAEYFATNVEGTRKLIQACRRAGVARFVYVSSIAVNFQDKLRYYYAQSKQQAEDLVRESGLRYTIVRPTMILGAGSPVLAGLTQLATKPVVPVFGDGGTRVQPIDVDDLADFLMMTVQDESLDGETIEFGGPEVVQIGDLLSKIHGSLNGGNRPKLMHIPMALIRPLTAAAETVAYSLTPITVGQLATFRFEGTAAANQIYERELPRLRSIDQMLARSFAGEISGQQAKLRRECCIFSCYLSGAEPGAYITEKYLDAHRKLAAVTPAGGFDALLVNLAAISPLFTRVADSYARLFAPTSALRKKLVLMLALLESSTASEHFVEKVDTGGKAVLSLMLLGHGLRFIACLAAGVAILTPCRLLARRRKAQPGGR